MGKNKTKTKKFAEVKRVLNPKEARVDKGKKTKKKRDDEPEVKHMCVSLSRTWRRLARNFSPLTALPTVLSEQRGHFLGALLQA